MKAYILMIFGLLFLLACSKTEVIHYNEGGVTVSVPNLPDSKVNSDANQQTLPNSSAATQDRQKVTQDIYNKKTLTFSVIPGKEYGITDCCSYGRLFAQAKDKRSSYSIEDIKNLLIEIYQDNCNNLDSFGIQRIYLRFSGDIQDSSYLTYFESVGHKRIQVDYKDVNSTFNYCS